MSLEKSLLPAWSSLSQPLLNRFKLYIQQGDSETVSTLFKSNPRYLVTASDFPTVLQLGCRYNACHVACMAGNSEILQRILEYLKSDELLEKIGIREHAASYVKRLLDLYLNTPDSTTGSTPLHFACKFGFPSCVELLLQNENAKENICDRYGDTPSGIVCARANPKNQANKEMIEAFFHDFYVALFRTSNEEKTWIEIVSAINLIRIRMIKNDKTLRAFIGPMNKATCEKCVKDWQKPTERFLQNIRKKDFKRGWQRHGRWLAQFKYRTEWAEYWDFAEEFLDLSTPRGLAVLEDHLQEYTKVDIPAVEQRTPIKSSQINFNPSTPPRRLTKLPQMQLQQRRRGTHRNNWTSYRSQQSYDEDDDAEDENSSSDSTSEESPAKLTVSAQNHALDDQFMSSCCLSQGSTPKRVKLLRVGSDSSNTPSPRTPYLIRNIKQDNQERLRTLLFKPSVLKTVKSQELLKLKEDSQHILHALPGKDPDLAALPTRDEQQSDRANLQLEFPYIHSWILNIEAFLIQ